MFRKLLPWISLAFLFSLITGAKSDTEKVCECDHEIPDSYVADNTLICVCSNTHSGKGKRCKECQQGNHNYITYAEYRKKLLGN